MVYWAERAWGFGQSLGLKWHGIPLKQSIHVRRCQKFSGWYDKESWSLDPSSFPPAWAWAAPSAVPSFAASAAPWAEPWAAP